MGGSGASSGGGGVGGGKTYGGERWTITQQNVDKLISMGATRWTKGDNDRLYLNDAGDKIMGMEVDTYKSGNIMSATLNGERISNSQANKIRSAYSKAYINLKTGGIGGLIDNTYSEQFLKKIKKYRGR